MDENSVNNIAGGSIITESEVRNIGGGNAASLK
jgi:hypothetical protein